MGIGSGGNLLLAFTRVQGINANVRASPLFIPGLMAKGFNGWTRPLT